MFTTRIPASGGVLCQEVRLTQELCHLSRGHAVTVTSLFFWRITVVNTGKRGAGDIKNTNYAENEQSCRYWNEGWSPGVFG